MLLPKKWMGLEINVLSGSKIQTVKYSVSSQMQNLEFRIWFLGERSSLWRGEQEKVMKEKEMYIFPFPMYVMKAERGIFAGKAGPAGGTTGNKKVTGGG